MVGTARYAVRAASSGAIGVGRTADRACSVRSRRAVTPQRGVPALMCLVEVFIFSGPASQDRLFHG